MPNLKTVLKLTLYLVIILAATSCAKTPAINSQNGISSIESVELGNVKQWLLIRGADADAPLLLFLHGGPGSPEMPIMPHYTSGLEDHFVVVHWDQRGAGKSYHVSIPEDSMNIEQFVSDAYELTQMLRLRFDKEKIYLVGHSWGSMMGVLLIKQYPELFHAYVGIGQVVDLKRNESISYLFTLDEAYKRNNKTAIRELEGIGPPPYAKHSYLVTQRKWLVKFGGALYGKKGYGEQVKVALAAPEYGPVDYLKFIHGGNSSTKLMWEEMQGCNFIEQAPRLEVPVYFFAGRHDYNTPFELVEEYYEMLDAPAGKHLVWFENSAHSPNLEEPRRFIKVMVEQVLGEP